MLCGTAMASPQAQLDATMRPMNKTEAAVPSCAECGEDQDADHNAGQRARTRSAPGYPEASRMEDEPMIEVGAPQIEQPGVSLPAGAAAVLLPGRP